MDHYRVIASLLDQHASPKTLVARHALRPALLPLLAAAKHHKPLLIPVLQRIYRESGATFNNLNLALVMLAELARTGTIKGGGSLRKVLLAHKHLLNGLQVSNPLQRTQVQIRLLRGKLEGHQPNFPLRDHYTLTKKKYDQLRKEGTLQFIGQSFGSSLPPYLLLANHRKLVKPDQPIYVIDCTAAPGNKTLQLCKYSDLRARVLAFELDSGRFQVLRQRLQLYPSKATCLNQDFLQADLNLEGAKFIMADPSCSSSGMRTTSFIMHEPFQDYEQYCADKYASLSADSQRRVHRLSQFQLKVLEKAASARPIRLTYSTCSIFQQENQQVVSKFLERFPEYRLERWRGRAEGVVGGFGGQHSLRVLPGATDAIFVAVLRRRAEV